MTKLANVDLGCERMVLATAMLEPERIHELRDVVTPELFHEPRNADTWIAICAVTDAGHLADTLIVRGQLKAMGKLDEEHLLEITNVIPVGSYALRYAMRLRELATTRAMLRECRLALAESDDGIEDHRDFNERIERAVVDAARTMIGASEPIRVGEAVRSLLATARAHDGRLGESTGLADLDAMTGGMEAGKLWVIGARTGVGKSALALHLARVSAQSGKRPLLCSVEMSAHEIAGRIVSQHTRIDLRRFLDMGPAAIDVLASNAEWADKLAIHIIDSGSLTASEVRRVARALRAKHGSIDCVLVDYLQLMQTHKERGRSREQEIAEMSREFKLLARALDCPVVLCAQLNRDSVRRGESPKLSDLRESGAIEQDADVVLLMHRQELHDADAERGVCEIIVAKNRNGPTGLIKVRFAAKCVRFDNLAPDWRTA